MNTKKIQKYMDLERDEGWLSNTNKSNEPFVRDLTDAFLGFLLIAFTVVFFLVETFEDWAEKTISHWRS